VAAPFPDVGSLEHASIPPNSATPPLPMMLPRWEPQTRLARWHQLRSWI
jgi:hypothetical protein